MPAAPPGHPLDSGVSFRLDAKRLVSPRNGSLPLRRMVEALHGMGCELVEGKVALEAGSLGLEITTNFDQLNPPCAGLEKPTVVQPEWLEHFPADDLMAVVSIAIDPEPTSWRGRFPSPIASNASTRRGPASPRCGRASTCSP